MVNGHRRVRVVGCGWTLDVDEKHARDASHARMHACALLASIPFVIDLLLYVGGVSVMCVRVKIFYAPKHFFFVRDKITTLNSIRDCCCGFLVSVCAKAPKLYLFFVYTVKYSLLQ